MPGSTRMNSASARSYASTCSTEGRLWMIHASIFSSRIRRMAADLAANATVRNGSTDPCGMPLPNAWAIRSKSTFTSFSAACSST